MIPILFEKNETIFTTNGLGRLTDCISCLVTEERNGIYTCEFTYPVSGVMFDEIQKGRIIACTHDDSGDIQPFDIYASTEPINGVVTFFANHISYRLNEITCAPFTANSAATALSGLVSNSYTTNDFTMTTDIVSSTPFNLAAPTPVRSALGGIEGSVLDTYGGEYEFDKFSVILHANRGTLKDYEVRYGKNLTEYEDNIDYSGTYNGVVPYWKGIDEESNEVSVIGAVTMSGQSHYSGRDVVVPMDLSGEFEDVPTAAELEAKALAIMTNNQPWLPNRNITVTAIPQWQSEEYSLYQSIGLCDTIKVVFPLYNMTGTMKIVKTIHNVLRDKYDSFELGRLQTTLAQAINANVEPKISEIESISKGAFTIADNSAQHFWFKSTGGDTGAHIAEVDRATFEATPQGGNLLARSNGIAVRDGLDELSIFGASGMRIGKPDEKHIEVTPSAFNVYDEDGSVPFSVDTANSLTTWTHSCRGAYLIPNTSLYQQSGYIFLKGQLDNNEVFFGVSTSGFPSTFSNSVVLPSSPSTYPTAYQTVTIDGIECSARWEAPSMIGVLYENTTSTAKFAVTKLTELYYETWIKVNDAQLSVGSERMALMDTTGEALPLYCYGMKYGHIVSLNLGVSNTSAVSNGGLLYEGTAVDLLPSATATLIGSYGNKLVYGTIYSTGKVTVYNTSGATIPANASVYLTSTYVCK